MAIQPAEEFLIHLLAEGHPGPVCIKLIQDRDRDVRQDERRKTLVDAAKAECPSCKKGLPYLDALGMHTNFEGRHTICLASTTLALIAKLDAEANHGG